MQRFLAEEPGIKYLIFNYEVNDKGETAPVLKPSEDLDVTTAIADLNNFTRITFCRGKRIDKIVTLLEPNGKEWSYTKDDKVIKFKETDEEVKRIPLSLDEETKEYATVINGIGAISLKEENAFKEDDSYYALVVITDQEKEAVNGITHESLLEMMIGDLAYKANNQEPVAKEKINECVKKLKEAYMWLNL